MLSNCMPFAEVLFSDLFIDGALYERGTTDSTAELFKKFTGEDFLNQEDRSSKFLHWLDFMIIVSMVNFEVGQVIQVKDQRGQITKEGLIGQALAQAEEQI